MPKFYIHSGSFKKLISKPNYLQALIFMFENLNNLEIRQKLGPHICIDQRGWPYDLLDKTSRDLLGEFYICERKDHGIKVKISFKDFLPGSKLSIYNDSDILFFDTKQVIGAMNDFKNKN